MAKIIVFDPWGGGGGGGGRRLSTGGGGGGGGGEGGRRLSTAIDNPCPASNWTQFVSLSKPTFHFTELSLSRHGSKLYLYLYM